MQNQFDTEEQHLEDEQDLMGLYQTELTKQIHLRNRQRKEWDMLKKKTLTTQEQRESDNSREEQLLQKEKDDEDKIELQETQVSKRLTNDMLKSARQKDGETLQKAVEVIYNQTGIFTVKFDI